MSLTRRSLLKTGAALSAASALPATAHALQSPDLIVYDSRLPESVAAMKSARAALVLDLAAKGGVSWTALQALPQDLRSAQGLTGWSDWVGLRGYLEDRGLRLKSETSVPAPVSGKAHLFRWEMG